MFIFLRVLSIFLILQTGYAAEEAPGNGPPSLLLSCPVLYQQIQTMTQTGNVDVFMSHLIGMQKPLMDSGASREEADQVVALLRRNLRDYNFNDKKGPQALSEAARALSEEVGQPKNAIVVCAIKGSCSISEVDPISAERLSFRLGNISDPRMDPRELPPPISPALGSTRVTAIKLLPAGTKVEEQAIRILVGASRHATGQLFERWVAVNIRQQSRGAPLDIGLFQHIGRFESDGTVVLDRTFVRFIELVRAAQAEAQAYNRIRASSPEVAKMTLDFFESKVTESIKLEPGYQNVLIPLLGHLRAAAQPNEPFLFRGVDDMITRMKKYIESEGAGQSN